MGLKGIKSTMNMKKIKIIIEKSTDHYNAYADNVRGIYAGGDTVEEVKQSVLESIALLKEFNDEDHIPSILKGEYEIVYKFDTESFLDYYKGIINPVTLHRLTGINQKQLQHYASGHSKPRKAQRKKIEEGLHKLGKELLAIEL